MFKNMLKRSWLSVKRKLGRTVILTLLFFITGTVFAGALGNSILEDQTASSNEQSEKNFGRPSASTGGMAGMPGMPSGESSSRGSAPNFPGGEMPNMKEAMNAGREEKKVELNIKLDRLAKASEFFGGFWVLKRFCLF